MRGHLVGWGSGIKAISKACPKGVKGLTDPASSRHCTIRSSSTMGVWFSMSPPSRVSVTLLWGYVDTSDRATYRGFGKSDWPDRPSTACLVWTPSELPPRIDHGENRLQEFRLNTGTYLFTGPHGLPASTRIMKSWVSLDGRLSFGHMGPKCAHMSPCPP